MGFIDRRVYHSCLIVAYLLVGTAFANPMPTKNHSPVWFGLLYPTPDKAGITSSDKVAIDLQFDYSNIYVSQSGSGWSILQDMELAQYTLDLRKGFGSSWELGIEQAVFYLSGGFLDQAILGYHDLFGFPNYPGQRAAPRNRYLYRVSHNGKTWSVPKANKFILGDTNIWVKKEFYDNDGTVASLKVMAQAPTASTSDGLGNGSLETALLFLLTSRNEKFVTTLNGGVVFPGSIDRGDDYSLKNFWVGHLSVNYLWKSKWTLIVQSSFATSPYSAETLPYLNTTWAEITFGLRYKMESGTKITLGFSEDLSQTSPDFTMHLSTSF